MKTGTAGVPYGVRPGGVLQQQQQQNMVAGMQQQQPNMVAGMQQQPNSMVGMQQQPNMGGMQQGGSLIQQQQQFMPQGPQVIVLHQCTNYCSLKTVYVRVISF